MVTFWGAIKLYFQINMTKALILNVMPDMIVVKYVNFGVDTFEVAYSAWIEVIFG